jgi:hypothetical protein
MVRVVQLGGPAAAACTRAGNVILTDQRDHALAGGVVELPEGQLADGLVAEAAPGQH